MKQHLILLSLVLVSALASTDMVYTQSAPPTISERGLVRCYRKKGIHKSQISRTQQKSTHVPSIAKSSPMIASAQTVPIMVTATQKPPVSRKASSDRIVVNELAAVVHGPERSAVFSTLGHQRRGIDGRQRSLGDQIADELIYQDALRVKMPVDDSVVKGHLRKVLQGFGLKPGDEEGIFAQEGYSYGEGFEQFRTMYAVNAMTDHQIMQNLFVSDEEVVAYYNANPIIKEPAVLLQTAAVPFEERGDQGKKKALERVQDIVKTGVDAHIEWSSGHWVKKSELSAQLHTLLHKDIGFILPIEGQSDIFLYRLLNKKEERAVPLAKRYKKIVELLKRPKYEELYSDYRKRLMNNATIIYMS